MAKKLGLADKFLLGVYFLDEVIDTFVGAGHRAYRTGKLFGWTPPGYKGTLLNQNIYRLLKTGNLEKVMVKGEPVLKITRGGRDKLARRIAYFKLRGKGWDRRWRLVIFDISEREKNLRNQLRSKLIELGFGRWQKSIYISPYDLEEDINEFLNESGLRGRAYVLTAKHKLMGDARELADQVWGLTEINLEYTKVLSRLDNSKYNLAKLYEQYLGILASEPVLPRELLPGNWVGDQVREKLIRAMGSLI